MNDSHLLENITCRIDKASANLSQPKEEAKEASPLPKQEFTLPSPLPSSVVPEGNTEQSMISETASQGEAPRNSDNQSQGIASNSNDSQHGASQNQSRRSRDFEREFNQNGLQYLLQNLDNLREILQIVIMNSELATSLNVDLRNRGLFNLGIAQSLNNTQLSILNSQNQIYDQLRDIRRIIDENSENDSTNSLLNFLNPNNPNLIRNNQNQNPLGILSRIMTKIFGVQFSKSYNRFFLFFFVCSIAILVFGLSSLPSSYLGSPAYLIDWIVSQRRSKSVLIGSTLLYVLIILKFNQILYDKYTPDPHREQNFFKDLYVAFAQYTPLYDLTFLLMTNPEIVENKLEFFFVFCLLIWYLVMAKVTWLFYQKFNRALVMLNPSQASELGFIKRIQYIMALYIFLNLLMSYGVLWMSWYANDNVFSALLGMALFTSFEPLKGFVSASISIRNCSIVSNNNTRQLHDPKLQSEIILDALYHVVFLGIICLLGIGYPKYLIGFIALYCLSGYNALQKLACCYQKYAEWKLLQKRLDEIFPIIEQEKSEDCICSICHEALLIGRKLPCGHIFHLKCFVYWLENKKNCPNCRADLMNLSDIRNHSQQENRFAGWFTRIQELVSNLFN